MARVFERGLTQAVRLRAAGAALATRAPQDRALDQRDAGRCGAGSCSWCPATRPVGFRLPLGSLPLCAAGRLSLHPSQPTRSSRAAPLPDLAAAAARAGRARASRAAEPRAGRASSRRSPTSAARCAPRCRSSRATACSASSCRRSSGSRTISTCVAAVEATAAELGLPVHIEGYRRRTIRGSNVIKRHARPRRDRGQHPPGRQLARLRRHHRRPSTRRRARSGSAPTSS